MPDLTALIEEEEGAARHELKGALADDEPGKGLEVVDLAILAFLGSQVVLPIVCSFVEQALWERYRRIRTKKQAAEARAELADAEPGAPAVDRETVLGEIIDGLVEESVPPQEAARIAQQHYRRVQERLGPPPG